LLIILLLLLLLLCSLTQQTWLYTTANATFKRTFIKKSATVDFRTRLADNARCCVFAALQMARFSRFLEQHG
jgi:hypothetical protein